LKISLKGVSSQILHVGLDSNARRSTKTRSFLQLWSFSYFQVDRKWQEMANNVSDMELFSACQADAKEPSTNLKGIDPSLFMPPPMDVRSVLNRKVRKVGLKESLLS
jgi:hypothetical protein